MKDYKNFLTKKNETWQQALNRFEAFCHADMKDYFSTKDYSYSFSNNKSYKLYRTETVSPEYISGFTSDNNINVPDELKNLLCNFGTFRIGDTLFEIFNNTGTYAILTLQQILDKFDYGKFTELIGPGMFKSLSSYYYFFGVSFPLSAEMTFIYFTKAGNFGKMLFSQDNQEIVLQKILPSMFNGSIEKYTLNSLVSNQIDRIIINALMVKGYIN